MKKHWIAGAVVCAAACGSAYADIPVGDVLIGIDAGRVSIGRISEDGLTWQWGERVFFAELGEDVPNAAAEPGFQSLPGGLAGEPTFSFDFSRALRKWNGTDFSLLPTETLTSAFGPASATTPSTDTPTPGLTFSVDPSGAHDHADWILNSPASDGVYLVEILFDTPNADPSLPVWMLFAQNSDPTVNQAAFDYAAANIPSPGVAAVFAAGLCVASRRRRR